MNYESKYPPSPYKPIINQVLTLAYILGISNIIQLGIIAALILTK